MSDRITCRSCGGTGEAWYFDEERGDTLENCRSCGGDGFETLSGIKEDRDIARAKNKVAMEAAVRAVERADSLLKTARSLAKQNPKS